MNNEPCQHGLHHRRARWLDQPARVGESAEARPLKFAQMTSVNGVKLQSLPAQPLGQEASHASRSKQCSSWRLPLQLMQGCTGSISKKNKLKWTPLDRHTTLHHSSKERPLHFNSMRKDHRNGHDCLPITNRIPWIPSILGTKAITQPMSTKL